MVTRFIPALSAGRYYLVFFIAFGCKKAIIVLYYLLLNNNSGLC